MKAPRGFRVSLWGLSSILGLPKSWFPSKNRENKHQPTVSEETGLLDLILSLDTEKNHAKEEGK